MRLIDQPKFSYSFLGAKLRRGNRQTQTQTFNLLYFKKIYKDDLIVKKFVFRVDNNITKRKSFISYDYNAYLSKVASTYIIYINSFKRVAEFLINDAGVITIISSIRIKYIGIFSTENLQNE